MASMMVDLPEPVGPSSRKSPARPTVAKSMTSVPAYGPMAVMDRWCSCTSRHLLRLGEVLGLDRGLVAGLEDVDLARAGLGLGDVGDEVGAELTCVALAHGRRAGAPALHRALGLVEDLQRVGEAGLETVHQRVWPHPVGDGYPDPALLGGRELRRLEQLVEATAQ